MNIKKFFFFLKNNITKSLLNIYYVYLHLIYKVNVDRIRPGRPIISICNRFREELQNSTSAMGRICDQRERGRRVWRI